MSEQSYRESHKNKGADYHETFTALKHRRLLWDLEKTSLRRIAEGGGPGGKPRHLDFACGTGRVLAFLSPYASASTGLDISESMLSQARKNAPGAEFHVGDITRESLLDGRKFDLITAFRFFPNAEQQLREEVIRALALRLAPDGRLVFNNHMNSTSLLRALLSLKGYRPNDGMSLEQVRSLVSGAGLFVERVIPLGMLPLTDKLVVGPYQIWREIERVVSMLAGSERRAQDNLYVCRRR